MSREMHTIDIPKVACLFRSNRQNEKLPVESSKKKVRSLSEMAK